MTKEQILKTLGSIELPSIAGPGVAITPELRLPPVLEAILGGVWNSEEAKKGTMHLSCFFDCCAECAPPQLELTNQARKGCLPIPPIQGKKLQQWVEEFPLLLFEFFEGDGTISPRLKTALGKLKKGSLNNGDI